MLSDHRPDDGCYFAFGMTRVVGTLRLEGFQCSAVLSWVWVIGVNCLHTNGYPAEDIVVPMSECALR